MASPGSRHFLQIPGPTNVPDRVLRAIDRPTIDHRGPEFAKLTREVLAGLQHVFRTRQPVIVYPGPVVYEAAPVLVPGYYGHPYGYWRYPHRHHGYDGYRQGGWRHQHQPRGHRR